MIVNQPYDRYAGPQSREEAEKLLKSTITGSFVIRDSTKSPGDYSLSVKLNGEYRMLGRSVHACCSIRVVFVFVYIIAIHLRDILY